MCAPNHYCSSFSYNLFYSLSLSHFLSSTTLQSFPSFLLHLSHLSSVSLRYAASKVRGRTNNSDHKQSAPLPHLFLIGNGLVPCFLLDLLPHYMLALSLHLTQLCCVYSRMYVCMCVCVCLLAYCVYECKHVWRMLSSHPTFPS